MQNYNSKSGSKKEQNNKSKIELSPEEQAALDGLVDGDAGPPKFGWDDTFQRHILAIMLTDHELMAKAVKLVEPGYFTNAAHGIIATAAIKYFKEFGALPEKFWLMNAINEASADKGKNIQLFNRAECQNLLEHYVPGLESKNALWERIKQFAKFQALKSGWKIVNSLQDNPQNADEVVRGLIKHFREVLADTGTKQDDDFVDIATLLEMPKASWAVKGHFPKDATGVIYGPSGAGKTFVALDMAMSIATGRPFIERFKTTKGRVVYVCAEGLYGFQERVQAWLNVNKQQWGMPDKSQIWVKKRPVNFLDPDCTIAFLEQCREHFNGEYPDVIFIDTLAKNFGGGDENSTKDMSLYVMNTEWMRAESGGTIISVHHSGKDIEKGMRGNSALKAGVDVEILVVEGNCGPHVTVKKQKNDKKLGTYMLNAEPVYVRDDDDGQPWSTLVMQWAGWKSEIEKVEKEEKAKAVAEKSKTIEQQYIDAVPACEKPEGEIVLADGITATAVAKAVGMTEKAERKMRGYLLQKGVIKTVEYRDEKAKHLLIYRPGTTGINYVVAGSSGT